MAVMPAPLFADDPTVDRRHAVVKVLDEDTELLGSAEIDDTARQYLVARTVRCDPGAWTPLDGDVPCEFDSWLGVLVLDGLLAREVVVDGLRCCELLGPGDVLRPWDEDGASVLPMSTCWRVLEPTRLALLDAGFARRAARWPSLHAELMRRLLARGHSLTVLLALTQARRADVRLRALFAHLADRWGRVTPDGIVLPLRLTHSVIAQLAGLRRPSVSLTLSELERAGEIVRLTRDQWLLAASE